MIKPDFKKILPILFLLVSYGFGFTMTVGSGDKVSIKQTLKDSIVKQIIDIEHDRVIKRANKFLDVKPQTVTASSCSRSMGGKHDFFSEGPYWWPDPANPDGPYIKKDGLRNSDRFENDDKALTSFSELVSTLTSAYLLTGKEKYVTSAMQHLKAWFVDTTTRMNPNMLYAQAIRGVSSGRGVGIIDAVPLIDVAKSVMILEHSPYVSSQDIEQFKEWFQQFILWFSTHPNGIHEMKAKNNHGAWWHAQVAAYASLTGDQKALQLCLNHYKEILLPDQMALDGSFPLELARTKPYAYSLFVLDAMSSLAWTLSDTNFNVWNYTLPDMRGLTKGLDFIMPYLKDKTKWPYAKDVANWDDQPNARQFMLLAALAGNNPEWFKLWKALDEKNKSFSASLKNPLLWIGLTPKEIESGKTK